MPFKLYKSLLWVQGAYTLLTALWGLVHIESFMKVTGPKYDVWLVKTVSAILVAAGTTLLFYTRQRAFQPPAALLGGLLSGGLTFIDFYYAAQNTISGVYALDGLIQLLFTILWGYITARSLSKR